MNFKLTKDHVKEAIFKNPKFAFLRKIVEDIEPEQTSARNTTTIFQKGDTIGQEIPVNSINMYNQTDKSPQNQMVKPDDSYVYQGGLSYMSGTAPPNKR